MTAFRAKDVNAIMGLCVPDESLVVFDVTPPRQRNGADAYRKDWEEAFSRFDGPLEAEISEVDVTAGGDVAYVSSIHHVTGTMKGGKKIDYTVTASRKLTASGLLLTRMFLFRLICGRAKPTPNRSPKTSRQLAHSPIRPHAVTLP
jgi:ketosteroid isomerase-like protein